MNGVLIATFTGADSRASAQSISLPGAKVGDTVAMVASVTSGGVLAPSFPFETAISVDDQIQQLQTGSGNLSAITVKVMLVR